MSERSGSVRAAILVCSSVLVTGCITNQDLPAVSDPNDVAASAQQPVVADAGKRSDIALPSDANWEVYSSDQVEPDAYVGKAQYVCSYAGGSAQCPAGALDYGYGESYWTARINACEGKSRWIWAPGITVASSPAELATYYFVNHLSVSDHPTTARVIVAADDQAEVIVNGTAVGATGSITDVDAAWASQHKPVAIDIAGALVTGMNTITIRVTNGTGAFANCSHCTYQQNPAGVVFCVDVRY